MPPSASFWDKIAVKYAATAISDLETYFATLKRTLAHLNATDHVLEIGCGTASTALELAPHVAHITATDVSPAMIEIAQNKVAETNVGNITLQTAPACAPLQRDGAPFDAVLALNLLHLLPNQDEVLTQVHASLKPGGLFISKTACLGEAWFLKPLVTVMTWFGKAPFVLHQRQDALRSAILSAGFEMVDGLSQTGTPPRLYMIARRV